MASNNARNVVAYGLSQALENLPPQPIVAKKDPQTNDFALLGTLWVRASSNSVWVLTSIVNNSATWESITGSGGGAFSSLTVNPGPTNLSTVGGGAVTIGNSANNFPVIISSGSGGVEINGHGNNIGFGNDAAANAVFIGTFTNGAITTIEGGNGTGIGGSAILLKTAPAGDIYIGGSDHTGVISMGNSTAAGGETVNIGDAVNTGAQIVNIAGGASGANSTVNILSGNATAGTQTLNIGTGSGGKTINIGNGAGSNIVTLGSSNTTSTTIVEAGTGGLLISGGQIVSLTNVNSAASPYSLLATDQFVAVNPTAGVVTVTLPASPLPGRWITIYDATGQAAAHTITISGNGNNISAAGTSASTQTLTTAYSSMNLWFNGTIWNAQKIAQIKDNYESKSLCPFRSNT